MKYDLVKDDEVLKTLDFTGQPPVLHGDKGQWMRRIENRPPHDTKLQVVEFSERKIVGNNSVYDYSVRDKTVKELNEEKMSELLADLHRTDKDFCNTVDELIDVLILNNILNLEMFDISTQETITKRKQLINEIKNLR